MGLQAVAKEKRTEPIQARVKRLHREAEKVEGVQPLNPGFFELERRRRASVEEAKLRSTKRQPL